MKKEIENRCPVEHARSLTQRRPDIPGERGRQRREQRSGSGGGVGNADADDTTKAITVGCHLFLHYLLSLKNMSLHARMPFALLSLSGEALG